MGMAKEAADAASQAKDSDELFGRLKLTLAQNSTATSIFDTLRDRLSFQGVYWGRGTILFSESSGPRDFVFKQVPAYSLFIYSVFVPSINPALWIPVHTNCWSTILHANERYVYYSLQVWEFDMKICCI
jgi:hypothetical protein